MCAHVVTFVFACRNTLEIDHAQIQTLLQPDSIHDTDHLKSQHVLPQVFTDLQPSSAREQVRTNRE